MSLRSAVTLVAGAITALALWPVLSTRNAPAASVTPAPIVADYQTRDKLITFYENQVREAPDDQIQTRMLAQQYLQRFREQYDLQDVTRAQRLAERSIRLQPQGNTSAQMTLAGALLTYHEFRAALVHERDAWEGEPFNANAQAQIASLELELGRYDAARSTLASIRRTTEENPTVDSVRARYAELTGNLKLARTLIADATKTIDSDIDNPAYDRSWFHMRAGQLAFESGDMSTAEAEYGVALADFPNNAMALMFEAQMYRGEQRWTQALAAAKKSADLYPLPQALGYEADTQRALHQDAAAAQTDALIDAEQRLFNAQGINDRLLANYYAQRHTHLHVALRAAMSDLVKRGDEIYADDTMAWTLAALGRWDKAYSYAERAVRLGTLDSNVQYHAGVIALHNGLVDEGRHRLSVALRVNPDFDPDEAAQARRLMTALDARLPATTNER